MRTSFFVLLALLGMSAATQPAHAGSCDCHWQRDSSGRLCGKRAANMKPGGANPMCDAGGVAASTATPPASTVQVPRQQSTPVGTSSMDNPFAARSVGGARAVECRHEVVEGNLAYDSILGGGMPFGATGAFEDHVEGMPIAVLSTEGAVPDLGVAAGMAGEDFLVFVAPGNGSETVMVCGAPAGQAWSHYDLWADELRVRL